MKQFLSESTWDARKSPYADHFKKLGFSIGEYGFLDKSETKLKVADAIKFAEKNGYRASRKPFVDMANITNYCFSKNGGPYADDYLTIDTVGGTYVRMIKHQVVVDKS